MAYTRRLVARKKATSRPRLVWMATGMGLVAVSPASASSCSSCW
jgi:hypothetical protein